MGMNCPPVQKIDNKFTSPPPPHKKDKKEKKTYSIDEKKIDMLDLLTFDIFTSLF